VNLDALEVLEDENKDHNQDDYADDERRPGSTEAGLLLAWVRLFCFFVLNRRIFQLSKF